MSEKGPIASVEEHNAHYLLYIRRYAAGQYLANLAYYLAEQKELPQDIFLLMVEGNFKKYQIQQFKLKKGMIAYLLLPEDKSARDVKVIFRGTDNNDLKSHALNLEPWGPGTASFAKEKENIFTTFNDAITQHYGAELPDLTLEVSGHSQGGALSQLFITEFLRRRDFGKEYDAFKRINMTVFNSPGVPHSEAKSANESVIYQWVCGKKIEVSANFGMVGGDAIQVTGNDMIFVMLDPFWAQVNLLKMDLGLEGSWLKGFHFADGLQPSDFIAAFKNAYNAMFGAHSSFNFYAPLDEHGKINVTSKYDYYTNEKPSDIPKLRQELLNKALYLQYFLFAIKALSSYCLDSYNDYSPKSNRTNFVPMSMIAKEKIEASLKEEAKVEVTSKFTQ